MIERKLKICSGCQKPRVIWKRIGGKGFCKECCYRDETGVVINSKNKLNQQTRQKPIPSRSPIKKVSDKKQKKDVLYKVLREQFLKDHPRCMIAVKGICTGRSNQIHHSQSGKDREQYYLDTTTWFATDAVCHEWVHDHPIQSKELGFLK